MYKAVLINNDAQFLHLSRYIHKQALDLKNQPCSYPEYLGLRQTLWIKPDEILNYFSRTNPSLSYQNFVAQQEENEKLKDLTLDEA